MGSHFQLIDSLLLEPPVEHEARRPGLVGDVQLAAAATDLAQTALDRVQVAANLALAVTMQSEGSYRGDLAAPFSGSLPAKYSPSIPWSFTSEMRSPSHPATLPPIAWLRLRCEPRRCGPRQPPQLSPYLCGHPGPHNALSFSCACLRFRLLWVYLSILRKGPVSRGNPRLRGQALFSSVPPIRSYNV